MTELEKYIKSKSLTVGMDKVRYEMEKKSKETADRFEPEDPDRNKLGANFYLLGMYDLIELIYS